MIIPVFITCIFYIFYIKINSAYNNLLLYFIKIT